MEVVVESQGLQLGTLKRCLLARGLVLGFPTMEKAGGVPTPGPSLTVNLLKLCHCAEGSKRATDIREKDLFFIGKWGKTDNSSAAAF